jgi:uroporphyrinogen decarboxylase
LLVGGETLKRQTSRILDTLGHGPFIFNLGHGVLQHTPPEHVAELVAQVRGWSAAARN